MSGFLIKSSHQDFTRDSLGFFGFRLGPPGFCLGYKQERIKQKKRKEERDRKDRKQRSKGAGSTAAKTHDRRKEKVE